MRRKQYKRRKYFELSLPDISDLCWKAIVKWKDGDSVNDVWLKERIAEKIQARKEASQ